MRHSQYKTFFFANGDEKCFEIFPIYAFIQAIKTYCLSEKEEASLGKIIAPPSDIKPVIKFNNARYNFSIKTFNGEVS